MAMLKAIMLKKAAPCALGFFQLKILQELLPFEIYYLRKIDSKVNEQRLKVALLIVIEPAPQVSRICRRFLLLPED